VTDHEIAEHHNKNMQAKTQTELCLRFIYCRYQAVYLVHSITSVFFSHKLCSVDHMKAGSGTLRMFELVFFMQT